MSTTTSSRKLTLDDIADLRAYERERRRVPRRRSSTSKRRRRVAVGTARHRSVREPRHDPLPDPGDGPGRADRSPTRGSRTSSTPTTRLIPEPGQLSATLFIELTSDESMREWLPKLVGIERAVVLRLPNGDAVHCVVDPQHAAQLTRQQVTAAVHYITFDLSAAQRAAFGEGAVLVIEHPRYRDETALSPATVRELADDLRGGRARAELLHRLEKFLKKGLVKPFR